MPRASNKEQQLVSGGKRPEGLDKGFFYEPTVFIGTNDLRIAQEEIFGPVFTVIPYSGVTSAGSGSPTTPSTASVARSRPTKRRGPSTWPARSEPVTSSSKVWAPRRPTTRARRRPGPWMGRRVRRYWTKRRVWWLQAKRHRPRVGPPWRRGVHRDQIDHLELSAPDHTANAEARRRGALNWRRVPPG